MLPGRSAYVTNERHGGIRKPSRHRSPPLMRYAEAHRWKVVGGAATVRANASSCAPRWKSKAMAKRTVSLSTLRAAGRALPRPTCRQSGTTACSRSRHVISCGHAKWSNGARMTHSTSPSCLRPKLGCPKCWRYRRGIGHGVQSDRKFPQSGRSLMRPFIRMIRNVRALPA